MCAQLRAELKAAHIEAEVYGRPKHIYSIYRKMQAKRLGFEELFDVRAVRIIVASIPDCYAALGVVHGRWQNVPAQFDDYIATPKQNLYRSIHTAVIGPQQMSVEIQIRTREMHEQAELGVAAHWQYKDGGPRDRDYARKIEWVRRLLEPVAVQDTERDFLERMRAELFTDRIYALTPKGEVIDLPRAATPLDFAATGSPGTRGTSPPRAVAKRYGRGSASLNPHRWMHALPSSRRRCWRALRLRRWRAPRGARVRVSKLKAWAICP